MVQYLTPIAILGSALMALAVAVVGWFQNRKLAREQAAITLIFDQEPPYREHFRALWVLIQKGVDLEELATHVPSGSPENTWDQDREADNLPEKQRQWITVNLCLNYYETIAVAIDQGAIDETTVFEFLGPRMVYFAVELHPFIKAVRENPNIGDPTSWISLERLAKEWGAEFPSS